MGLFDWEIGEFFLSVREGGIVQEETIGMTGRQGSEWTNWAGCTFFFFCASGPCKKVVRRLRDDNRRRKTGYETGIDRLTGGGGWEGIWLMVFQLLKMVPSNLSQEAEEVRERVCVRLLHPSTRNKQPGTEADLKKLGKFLVCWRGLLKGNQQGRGTLHGGATPVPHHRKLS